MVDMIRIIFITMIITTFIMIAITSYNLSESKRISKEIERENENEQL